MLLVIHFQRLACFAIDLLILWRSCCSKRSNRCTSSRSTFPRRPFTDSKHLWHRYFKLLILQRTRTARTTRNGSIVISLSSWPVFWGDRRLAGPFPSLIYSTLRARTIDWLTYAWLPQRRPITSARSAWWRHDLYMVTTQLTQRSPWWHRTVYLSSCNNNAHLDINCNGSWAMKRWKVNFSFQWCNGSIVGTT